MERLQLKVALPTFADLGVPCPGVPFANTKKEAPQDL